MTDSQSLDESQPTIATPPTSKGGGARLWPSWLIMLIVAAAFVGSITPSIDNLSRFILMMLGPLLGAAMLIVWIAMFSRLSWRERIAVPVIAIATGVLAHFLSVETLGVSMWIYGVPLTVLAITLGETVFRRWAAPGRIAVVSTLIVMAWSWFPFVRNEGFQGDYLPEFKWRWTPTSEDGLSPIAATSDAAESGSGSLPTAVVWPVSENDWPNFRGPELQSRVSITSPALNWETRKPEIVWKKSIGPGWGSFSSIAGKLFTQEQRGEQEVTSCYDAATGEVVWQVADETRFSDVVSGAGPRSTPTYSEGKLLTLGAKALFSCRDAANGKLIWQRDLMTEVNAQLPQWGFSGSPIVVGDVAIIYAGGTEENGLMAVDCATGKTVWGIPSRGMNFSTAQTIQVAGTPMIIFGDDKGLIAVEPESGKPLWQFRPTTWRGPAMCQPQQIDDSSLVVPVGDGMGIARLSVQKENDRWSVSEVWTSNQLKPSFNDFVFLDGHLYGFDQNILVCVDAATGKRLWKKGRYGFGQMILLENVGQLIVLSEFGECVLIAADPSAHRELGRITAIDGKTWNHPIVVQDMLYVRNGAEFAALKLE